MPPLAIGLDLGGTKILGGLCTAEGEVIREVRVATPPGGARAGILAAMAAAATQLRDAAPAAVIGIGVSSAGHVDWETGDVVDGTPNIPDWAGTRLGAELRAATGLPVSCDNDGNAAAYGEAWVGAGRGCRAIVAITLGTGFGGGLYDRGAVVRGARGGGGEFGHIVLVPDGRPCNCGQQGCVEAYVSGTALEKQARALWGPEAGSRDVFERSRAGEAAALELVDEFARHLALVIVSLFNIADPDRLLVGGGLSTQADLYLPATRRRLARYFGG
ncbi:MAG: ROK family protein, partial [Candidatus Sericytochromatia bacterium]|nr:ROK family protein [Candidatus Tanganyikabacteria bacterium]